MLHSKTSWQAERADHSQVVKTRSSRDVFNAKNLTDSVRVSYADKTEDNGIRNSLERTITSTKPKSSCSHDHVQEQRHLLKYCHMQ